MNSVLANYQKVMHDAFSVEKETSPIVIAVSKHHDQSKVKGLIAAGHTDFGENKVQEAADKYTNLGEARERIDLHLIGPLQSNKVKDAVAIFDVIHTVDREKIARKLAYEIVLQNKNIKCFVQVNTGGEPQKAGLHLKEVVPQVTKYRDEYGLDVVGLMCIPPVNEDPEPHFSKLKGLANELGLKELSMGMSSDFQAAIRHGATYIRVGTKIFGARDHKVDK
jgi:pyridoxal phosphate enzyme (YggS family)